MDLDGRICLVTGASSGIGRATALALAAHGATVALAGRREPLLREVAAAGAESASVHPVDLADPAHALTLADEVTARHGRVDVLVNAAGERVDGSTAEVSPEALDRVFQVNTLAPFLLAGALAPAMAARGEGVIANLTSAIAGGRRGLSAYAATKAAVDSFTQSLRQEVGAKGVAVFAFDPGWVRTAMAPDGTEEPEPVAERLVAHIVAGRSAREPLR